MSEDYPNAAKRHLEDSKMLLEASRWDNSAYLAGYVIECSIKAVIAYPVRPDEQPWPGDGHDLSMLLFQLEQMAASRKVGHKRSVHSGLMSTLRTGISSNLAWHPRMRYEPSGAVSDTQAKKWLNLAERSFSGLAKDLCTGVVV